MGGAAAIVMLLGFVRIKFAAILVGATGIGLLASYTAIQVFTSTLSGFGLSSSAVREISLASGSDDQLKIDQVIFMLRRLSWFAGFIGMCLLMVTSPLISHLTFGSFKYTLDIAALGLVVLFGNLSAGELAALQGMRKISEMARVNIYATAIGAFAVIPFYFLMGLRGIVPGLIFGSISQFIFAHYFARRVNVTLVKQAWRDTFLQGKSLITLGFSFMWGGLLVSGGGYITIYLINRFESIQAAGLYSSAFVLSGAFVNFVLNAMSADYYPRLTGMANDKSSMCRLINQQTEIGLLLAIPGLLATIIFAPWLIKGLYSTEFMEAAPLLQWFALGAIGRVISWPMGFVILALGKDRYFFFFETGLNILNVLLVALGLVFFGIKGVAFAFCLLNGASIGVAYLVCKKLINFSWDADCVRLVVISVASLIIGLAISQAFLLDAAISVGTILVALVSIFSVRGLVKKIGVSHHAVQRLLKVPGFKFIAGI